jgi:hypothetical protein
LNATEDPFGFFAVEEKLKANRRTRAPTIQRTLRAASSDSIEENADESMQQAFATPKPTNPLRTPRKRTNAKKRKLELSTHSPSSCVGAEDREEEGESMRAPRPLLKLRIEVLKLTATRLGMPWPMEKERKRQCRGDERRTKLPELKLI